MAAFSFARHIGSQKKGLQMQFPFYLSFTNHLNVKYPPAYEYQIFAHSSGKQKDLYHG